MSRQVLLIQTPGIGSCSAESGSQVSLSYSDAYRRSSAGIV